MDFYNCYSSNFICLFAAVDSNGNILHEYRSYPQRWLILCSVLLLNISNYAHWIAFASVQSKAAEFYLLDHQGGKVNSVFLGFFCNLQIPKEMKRICTVSYGLGLPGCVAATVVLSKFGLRAGLYIGAAFTVTGGLLCNLSSYSVITDSTPPSAWYWMAVGGQALSGFGSPFISCVPTKVICAPPRIFR